MQGCPYAKEAFNTKLFVLLFIKKIWLIICAMLVGALVIGGGYYLKNVTFGGPEEYDITTTYYVQYNNYDPVTGEMHNYTNAATWGTWVVSDWYVDRVWNHALEAGFQPEVYGIEKSDLKGYFTADLPSDLRIPTSTVTTPYAEVTEILNDALQLTYQDFANEREEMASIEITNETPVAVADKDIRTLRAFVLGAVVGLFVACFGVAMMILWDDSVIIPESFTYRYGIPMAGYVGKEDKEFSEETSTNIGYLIKENNIMLAIGKMPSESLVKILSEKGIAEVISVAELSEVNYKKMRQAEGILLLVEANAHNGKEIEHVLHDLELQECTVAAALLHQADSKLIRCYRFGRKNHK